VATIEEFGCDLKGSHRKGLDSTSWLNWCVVGSSVHKKLMSLLWMFCFFVQEKIIIYSKRLWGGWCNDNQCE